MAVPWPFTRALYIYGEPIVVPRDADVEHYRALLERTMNELAERSERDFETLWKEN